THEKNTILKYLSQAVILQMRDHISRAVQSAYHTNRIRSLYDLPCLISTRRSLRSTDILSVSPYLTFPHASNSTIPCSPYFYHCITMSSPCPAVSAAARPRRR